jgi:hypothetical protein
MKRQTLLSIVASLICTPVALATVNAGCQAPAASVVGWKSRIAQPAFKAKDDPFPSGRPDPGRPDQMALVALSDLSIKAAEPVAGNPETLSVQVYNDGPANSAPTQLKFFYHKNGAVPTAQAPIPAIASKGSVWVVVGAGLPLNAADSVTVSADDPNVVNEKNELNNGFTYK